MKTTLTTIAALLLSTAAMADNVPQGGVKNSPATVALTAIGNGTPSQGVVRLTGPDGSQTFHAVDHTTTYRRAQGGTAVVNGGDGFTNAHEAELRNRAALIASLPPVDHPDYEERFAAIEGQLANVPVVEYPDYSDTFAAYEAEMADLRDQADAALGAASGAAALASIDFTQHIRQAGVGIGFVEDHTALAAKVYIPVSDTASVQAGLFTTGDVTGGTVSATFGF